MSKMDAMRAMREARYEQRAASATRPETRPATKRPAERAVAPEVVPPAADAEVPEVALCGHRAISGRTCTRESGHSAKSHRYS
jgi:hypothetical protein